MKSGWTALALGLFAAGAAQAADAPLVDHWNEPQVERLLQSLGANSFERTTLAGLAGVIARTSDGISIGVYAKACAAATPPAEPLCRGVEGISSFAPGPSVDRPALADRLNHQYAAGKFLAEQDGTIRLTRYIDVQGGVSEANLRAQLASYIALSRAARDAVWAAPAK